ncbi:uncharacterized protein LOC123705369 isoform X2 [Colias croceus]|uniref:uncharacterized protein LOC123705369 isoform X2 n=1 Tax=Colias crocea TaxID=72248 RepID=UPI001E27C083|nr:uncharacterized protein LOC123705369 isoform X2 [Colias croceus]
MICMAIVRDRTIQLLRACVVITQAYTTQFSNINDVSFRLYYNDSAPADYQAPGFVRMREEDHLKPTIQDNLRLGWVETPYHKIVTYSFYKQPSRAMRQIQQRIHQSKCLLMIWNYQSLCILRRTLELCWEVQTIGARDLMDKFVISESNAANLMQLLHSNKIIQQNSQSNLTTRQKIEKDQLKILMSNFFHTTEDNIVDLLLTEFASQESVPDPISGALNLTEKISIKRKEKRAQKRRIEIEDKAMIARTGVKFKLARVVLKRLLI